MQASVIFNYFIVHSTCKNLRKGILMYSKKKSSFYGFPQPFAITYNTPYHHICFVYHYNLTHNHPHMALNTPQPMFHLAYDVSTTS
jgi:hypothetical protein